MNNGINHIKIPKISQLNSPEFFNETPATAALASKLVTDRRNERDRYKRFDNYNFKDVSSDVSNKINSNESILKLFPDVEIAMQIMVSSILTPNDYLTSKIVYESPDISLLSSVKESLKATIEEHIETNYNLASRLYNIVKEAMFTKGAYIEAIIPEASLDNIINRHHDDVQVNIESLIKDHSSNFKPCSISLNSENISSGLTNDLIKQNSLVSEHDLGIEITDNIYILARPRYSIMNGVNQFRVSKESLINNSLDSLFKRPKYKTDLSPVINQEDTKSKKENKKEEKYKIFKDVSNIKEEELVIVPTEDKASRKSVSKPLVIKLPVESVIPVYVNNNPSSHIGYFVLVDDKGNPIDMNKEKEKNSYFAIGSNVVPSGSQPDGNSSVPDLKTSLINKAQNGLFGMIKKDARVNDIETLYSTIVENMILDKFKNTDLKGLIDIKDNADIYRVMMARALTAKKTKLIYLPADIVQYYAFEYRENGTGLSLLEKCSVLFSIAAIILLSKLSASVTNSIGITEVEIQLSDRDNNGKKTLEMIKSEFIKNRQCAIPIGIHDIKELTNWLTNYGYKFTVSGSKDLPEMRISYNEAGPNKKIPDDELFEDIMDMIIKGIGVSPDMVQRGYEADFAATVNAKNLLFAKRTQRYQDILVPQITSHVRKLIYSDYELRLKLEDIITANIKGIKENLKKDIKDGEYNSLKNIKSNALTDYIINQYMNGIYAGLPQLEFTDAKAMMDALDAYIDKLSKVLDNLYTTELIPEYYGPIRDDIDKLKGILKAQAIHDWMAENDVMPMLTNWYVKRDDGAVMEPILENHKVFLDGIIEQWLKYLKATERNLKKLNKDYNGILDKINAAGGDTDGSDSSDSDSSDDDMDTGDGSDGEDGGEGGDDFGGDGDDDLLGGDMPGDSENSEDTDNDKDTDDTEDKPDEEPEEQKEDEENKDEDKEDDK